MILSFTRRIASARRRAWSDGLRKMKTVSRCAVFTPTPGSFENSSISSATRDAMLLMILEHSWKPHAAGDAAEHLLLRLGSPVKGIPGRRQHHYLEISDIFRVKGLGIDLDSSDFKLAAHGDRYRAATSGTDELTGFQFLLHFHHLLLHFLQFTHVHNRYDSLLRANINNARHKRSHNFLHYRVVPGLLFDSLLECYPCNIFAHFAHNGKRW